MVRDKAIQDILRMRHELLKAMREYFYDLGYIEVETSNLMRTAPPDPQIDPLTVFVAGSGPWRLHTSPEMGMKKLLAAGSGKIFQICKVYRVEEFDEVHSIEFTMLEWYRKGDYRDIMREVEALVAFVSGRLLRNRQTRFAGPFTVCDLGSLFIEKTGIDPFALGRDGLFRAMQDRGFAGIDDRDDWNNLFFKLFIQDVEPELKADEPCFVIDWPQSVSTMAKRKDADPGRVERFELYINGLEIANGYTELLDREEQRARFLADNRERARLGKDQFPTDEEFVESIGKLDGPYAGVSIGVDRLLMVLLEKTRIDEVMVNRFRV
ncbi:MAG: Elongation factor P--(R)-beta-lysine ligase [Syntrophorhabdus sp. PtaU1.Bin058]|nr:MAG: Elongation factor P--(R)-beta-lysine ligase [Syntrophorhabdus sp. PtaU1.Bin058]